MLVRKISKIAQYFLFLMVLCTSIQSSLASSVNNTITVAKQGGDFTDIIAAVDSITDARSYNQGSARKVYAHRDT